MKKTLINWLGLLGIVSVLSYTAAVLFSPLAYPGYNSSKALRMGIYLFAVMNWISAVGYTMFPLSDAGISNRFQDIMHLVVWQSGRRLHYYSCLPEP